MNIWIIGASAGIGRQIAIDYLNQGHNVAISSRNEDSLKQIPSQANARNEKALILPLDVLDESAIKDSFDQIIAKWQKIDLFIYSSGIYEPMTIDNIDTQHAKKTINVNLTAIFDFLGLVIPHMKKNGSGQIGLIASVAGYVGLPKSYAYGASKAAIINLAQGLHGDLQRANIDISVINPGFVKTRLTDKNKFKMPFIITPQKASQAIIKGLENKVFDINFPKKFTFFLKFLAILPNFILLKILKNIKD